MYLSALRVCGRRRQGEAAFLSQNYLNVRDMQIFRPVSQILPAFSLIFVSLTASPSELLAQQSTDQTTTQSEQAASALPSMEEIEAAWRRGDFVFVRQGLKQLAEETSQPFAQYRYGRVLIEGRGGPRDHKEAATWLHRAADQGQVEAAVLLARLYLSNTAGGVERNPEQAVVLFRTAAARGNAEAQYYLGLLYGQGVGVAANPVEALAWMQAAAESGHVASQFELSRIYARGLGTEEDPVKALRWLQEAAGQGHLEAQYFLAHALDSGRGVAQDRDAALNWLLRSAEGGFLSAKIALGKKYLKGEGVSPNAAEALRWLGQGVEAGSLEASVALGLAFWRGDNLPANPQQARQLLEPAAQAGLAQASYAMADIAERGLGQPVDFVQAVALYRQAQAQGSAEAELKLGDLAMRGRLDGMMAPHRMVPWVAAQAARIAQSDGAAGNAAGKTEGETAAGTNPALIWLQTQAEADLRPAQTALGLFFLKQNRAQNTAAQWLQSAAQAGDPEAQYQLGRLYVSGEGVEQDYVQAHKWLNVAAAGGSEPARETRAVVADLMTADQVAEAQAAARVFFDQTAPVVQSQ